MSYREDFQLYRGRGCEACNQTGLKGRVALHELLSGSDELRNLIQNRAKTDGDAVPGREGRDGDARAGRNSENTRGPDHL